MRLLVRIISVLACVFLSGCAGPKVPESLEPILSARLDRYRDLVLRMDSAGITALFTSDGSIAHKTQVPIVGRPAIKEFLDRFASLEVRSYEIVADQTSGSGGTAVQSGRYRQIVRLPDGKVVEATGTFAAEWQRQSDGTWLIHAMRTAPAPRSRD